MQFLYLKIVSETIEIVKMRKKKLAREKALKKKKSDSKVTITFPRELFCSHLPFGNIPK